MEQNQLGPYRIVRKLGQGGMGAVYEGVHVQSGQRVAVKLLPEEAGQSSGFRARFEIEIETLRKLHHPNIVSLVGYGEQAGRAFYAMELVEGDNLQTLLDRGDRFDWQDVVAIGVQVCAALRHAHDRGITHRDLKPANLILAPDGTLKLSDFGIAKLWGAGGMTVAGGVVGTANFMSPEQAEGKPTTIRSDLYSLGCTLYALLTGRPPFLCDSMPALLRMHVADKPMPARVLVPTVPRALDTLLTKLMEKDPAHRPQRAEAVSRRLEEISEGLSDDSPEPVPAAPTRQRDLSPPIPTDTDATLDSPARTPAQEPAPAPSPEPDPNADTAVDHFTVVEEGESLQRESDAPPPAQPGRVFTPQTALVAVLLLAIAGGLYLFFRPASADALYQRITERAASNRGDQLAAALEDMQEFFTRFADDRRAPEVAHLRQEVDLKLLERQLLGLKISRGKSLATVAVERSYLEAMRWAEVAPDTAAAKLQAILDIHARPGADNSAQTEQVLELVRRQLRKLKESIALIAGEQRVVITKSLERAEAISAQDPRAAAQVCRGVIELFRDKDWASELVARARSLLERLPPPEPPEPPKLPEPSKPPEPPTISGR